MEIKIVWGKSEGKTLLSSFDKALLKAVIHNFNLIPSSSNMFNYKDRPVTRSDGMTAGLSGRSAWAVPLKLSPDWVQPVIWSKLKLH